MMCFLKRALPFMLTLIIGIGLGSVFGFNRSSTTTANNFSGFKWEPRHYHSGCRRRNFSDVTPLSITFQPSTHLTPDAVMHKTTGVVTLLVSFNADGTATVENRLSGLPDGLTEEAESVVERTQFTPEKVDGVPVTVLRTMNYIFTLNDSMTMEPK